MPGHLMGQCKAAPYTVSTVTSHSLLYTKSSQDLVMGNLFCCVSSSQRPAYNPWGVKIAPYTRQGSTDQATAARLAEIYSIVSSEFYCEETIDPSILVPRKLSPKNSTNTSMALSCFPLHSMPPESMDPGFKELCYKLMRTHFNCLVCG